MAKFITFEGMEGSGKSTQVVRLLQHFQQQQIPAIQTREPGGTPLAENIRALLLNGQEISDALTEFLLLTAARHDHVQNLIKPALAEGRWVVCDRFFDSSLVYQGVVKGLPTQIMQQIIKLTLHDFAPDATFVLDLNAQEAMQRLGNRAGGNHYDNKDLDFHQRIRQGFLQLEERYPKRIAVLDATLPAQQITQQIIAHLKLG